MPQMYYVLKQHVCSARICRSAVFGCGRPAGLLGLLHTFRTEWSVICGPFYRHLILGQEVQEALGGLISARNVEAIT